MDREKVISQVEEEIRLGKHWDESERTIDMELLENVLLLLEEHEAVKPILEQDSMVCGVCGHEVIWQKMLGDGTLADEELDYCPHCGRQVKWE